MALPLPTLDTEYASIDEVLTALAALQDALVSRRDRRGVFVTAYVVITRELRRRIKAGRFIDPAWVERYAVTFANLYRSALHAYEAAAFDAVPTSWLAAFRAADRGDELVVQDLFLGINAHVNNDLPRALNHIAIDPDRPHRYADHTSVNAALEATTNAVQARIARLYDPVLGVLDDVLGPVDEAVTGFGFAAARENAWDRAVALANARDATERARLFDRIDEHAGVVARLIIAPTVPIAALHALEHVERARDWTECLEDIESAL